MGNLAHDGLEAGACGHGKAPPIDAGYFPYAGKSLHEASPETGRKAVEYIVEQIGTKCKELLALHEDD